LEILKRKKEMVLLLNQSTFDLTKTAATAYGRLSFCSSVSILVLRQGLEFKIRDRHGKQEYANETT